MNLTVENYATEYEQYRALLDANPVLQAGHDYVFKVTKGGNVFSAYYSSPTIKKTIDFYFQKLMELKAKQESKTKAARKQSPAKEAKKAPQSKTPAAKQKARHKPAVPKAPKKEQQQKANATVEHIPSDIALVRKFTNLHGKVKTYDQILSIWRAFEKAVVERKVTKGSPYQAEIKYMKDSLTGALRAAKENGTIELAIPADRYQKFNAIAGSVERSMGVSLLLEFINITGRTKMQQRAKTLQVRIKKALEAGKLQGDRYLDEIKSALKDLDAYTGSRKARIEMNDYYLSGVGEIALYGCKCGTALQGYSRSQNAVILKLIQEKAKNFTAPEMTRVFEGTVAPSICKLIVRRLVDTRQLSINMLRNPAKANTGIALNGVSDEPVASNGNIYDFNAEVMDMRLRSAGRLVPERKGKPIAGLSGTDNVTHFPDAVIADEVKIISAADLVKQKFRTIGLQGKYRKLIGDPEPGFSAMIYGKPKEGKSTIAIDFAKDLTGLGRVLYVAFEEGQGYTLQDKVIRNHANVPGLDFANKLPDSLSGYRYAFIDSVTDAGYNEAILKALIKANKPSGISIVGVFHATKAGTFRGSQTFAHDVDVLIRVENGIVYAQGRYAPPTEMSIAAILPEQQQAA